MTAPLRARFGAVYRLDYYDDAAMVKIVQRAAGMLKVPADNEGISEVARRARGTPRIALRLLRRVRDFAQVRGEGVITRRDRLRCTGPASVDPLGLDDVDRRVLKTIIEKYDGGPVGLNTIAAAIARNPIRSWTLWNRIFCNWVSLTGRLRGALPPDPPTSTSAFPIPKKVNRLDFSDFPMEQTAKILVLLGGVFILAGGVVYLLSRLNINFNRMPGNFVYSGENMTVYIPCAASILISILLTVILNIIIRMMNK